jgi:transcriptional regulator with XRE-family HTH domain
MSSPHHIDYSLAPPDEPDPALGRVIRRLRKEQKLSQAELARRSEVAVGTISRIERGLIDPQWATVEKLAGGLGVSMKRIGTEVAEQND